MQKLESEIKTTLLIADDHPLFRLGMKQVLLNTNKFNLLDDATNGQEAIKLIQKFNPEIAILDIHLSIYTGLEVVRHCNAQSNTTEMILIFSADDPETFWDAIDLGVRGFVLKSDPVTEIVDAVFSVLKNKYYISPALSGLIVEKGRHMNHQDEKDSSLIESLSNMEKHLLHLIAELNSNQEIADQLFISKRTVENHKVEIAHKLSLESAKNLLRFAVKYKDKISYLFSSIITFASDFSSEICYLII